MPPREPASLLWDIVDEARFIADVTSGRTFRDYISDRALRRSVERALEIVGEATKQLRDERPELAERLTDAHKVIGLRNLLAHGYAQVRHERIWTAITESLPVLRAEAETLYMELGYIPPDGSD